MEIIVPVRSFLLIIILWQMVNLLELTRSQLVRPLCYTQISAANQACAFLYPELLPHSLVATIGSSINGSVTNGSRHDHHSSRDDHAHDDDDDDYDDDDDKDHEDEDDDDDDDDDGDDDDGGDDDNDDDGGDDDDEGGDDDDNGGNDDGGGDRRSRHKKRKHRKHRKPNKNKECCRWLTEVDNDCVCEALLYLPNFLVKPWHAVVVRVGQTCKFTYKCHGIE